MNISKSALFNSRKTESAKRQFEPYIPPEGVIPKDKKVEALAMDANDYNFLNMGVGGAGTEYFFPGYPLLATWSQIPEFRKMSDIISKEMVRKWITINSTGADDDTDRINEIEEAFKKFNVKDHFRIAAEHDGLYGRGQLYVDLKTPNGTQVFEDQDELESPLTLSKFKIPIGSLLGFVNIEPVWTYPGWYNSDNPLHKNYYRPSKWYVFSKVVHDSRLLMFKSREVPDLLKAAYNFGGLSLSQLALPYVENWTRTRDSIGELVHSFSVSGIKTDMSSTLAGTDDAEFFARAELFTNMRDNKGLMLLDKNEEEFFQFNTPLSGLSLLQAQAQEQMASVNNIPLVKFLGMTPSGLNASSEGEIKVFYDYISSMNETIFRNNLEIVLDIIQLHLFGGISKSIGFEFNSLHEPNNSEQAEIRKTDAETGKILVESGAISPDDLRKKTANDDGSGYNNLEVDDGEDLPVYTAE